MVKPHCSNFRIITAIFSCVSFFSDFQGTFQDIIHNTIAMHSINQPFPDIDVGC